MVNINLANNAGFCFGVKRAISLVNQANDKNIYILGQLIHNPQEMKRLENRGIKTISELNKNLKGTLVIRSHGVPDKIVKQAKDLNLKIIDATCPFVKQVHDISKQLEKQYHIIIFGEPNHPEVIGIKENLKSPIVIEKPEQVKDISSYEKIALVSQTTQDIEEFKKTAELLKNKCNELIIQNTICNATAKRQDSSKELAKKVNTMIIIGGKNSGNTKRLYEICRYIQPNTYHIETKEEIDSSWLKEPIGITAGASTPDWIINQVIDKIKKI